jgi:hypothetical protein
MLNPDADIMVLMGTDIKSSTIEDDFEAVLKHAFEGKPLDPDVARRIQERSAQITERIREKHGVVDDATFAELLDDE